MSTKSEIDNDRELQYRVSRLVKSGASTAEANRIVYGWSDPSMKEFWSTLWEDRPKDGVTLSQKEAFLIILKTSFGRDYSDKKQLIVTKATFDETCEVLVQGIKAGHVVKKVIKNKSMTVDKLFHDARSELQRLFREDKQIKSNFVRED